MASKTGVLTVGGTDFLTLNGGLNVDTATSSSEVLRRCNQVIFAIYSAAYSGAGVKLWLKTPGGQWVNIAVQDMTQNTSVSAGQINPGANATVLWGAMFPKGMFIDAKISLEAISAGTPTVELNAGEGSSSDWFSLPIAIASTPQTITSANANALAVGPNGTTNPTLEVDASTSSAATGLKVKSAAAASGLAISVISSGTNENGTLDAKGSGTFTIGAVSTGSVILGAGAALVKVPGTLTGGGLVTNGIQVGTAGPVIYTGSGAPSISAAVKGSLYLRTDGTSSSTRIYVASDAAGTWVAITTAS